MDRSPHNAPTTIDKLRAVFAVHGLPDTVVTDNGTSFTSELFSEFMQQNGIHHIRTAPFHPASNGLAERAVQTVKEGLKRMTGDSLSTRLSRFLFKYRLTPRNTTARTPAEMIMGSRPKPRLDLLRPDMKARVERKQVKQKELHDQHARERQLKPDDRVYVRNFSNISKQQWLPGIILKQSGPVSYVVRCSRGGTDY
jgi:transposase InsO family protein